MQFDYKYKGSTNVSSTASSVGLSFAPDISRDPTFFVGMLGKHVPFREAISALHHVVTSDLRYQPKDKTEYKAWAKQQEEIWLGEKMAEAQDVRNELVQVRQGLQDIQNKSLSIMGPFYAARKQYFDYLYQNDIDAWRVLDPVITINPDEMFFEAFSQDESTYARLGCDFNVFKNISEFECGTTNVDYSGDLYNEFQKIRDYKTTDFRVDPSGFEVKTSGQEGFKEVKIDLPDTWVRGFLQVSSAMNLPSVSFELHPMDVHNICFYLRRHKAKFSPRALKYILNPGAPVRIIFEPWNFELICARSIYTGATAREIRVWGRTRIFLLERLIPIAQRFKVILLGTGLPSFYVADMGDMTFTLGLSGWSANDWSVSGNFDLMAPRGNLDDETKIKVFESLKQSWRENAASLADRMHTTIDKVESALTAWIQAGRVMYDLNKQIYRVRELSREPLPLDKLRFANEIEAKAYTLQNQIQIADIRFENGKQLIGAKVQNKYLAEVEIDQDLRIVGGKCQCNYFFKNQMYKGPCEHILALKIKSKDK